MNNAEIAEKIKEEYELYGLSWRFAPVAEFRCAMQEKGVKSKDIAERLGVTEANISRLLRGDQNLKIDTLYLLALALEKKLEFTLSEPALDDLQSEEYWEPEFVNAPLLDYSKFFGIRHQACNDQDYALTEVANEGTFACC
jgi:transcriptional regulator with XRE-family HTH domain